MSNQAIVMIETRGYVQALACADAMVKAANVSILSRNEVGGGLVSVVIKGDVGAVKAATEAGSDAARVTLIFCRDHYQVYIKEVIPAMPLKYKILTKIALKIGAIQIEHLTHMQSDLCFYCKFGSGGHGKKSELPPMP